MKRTTFVEDIISQRRKGAKFLFLSSVCHPEERRITLETPHAKWPIFVELYV